jgi:hypothetical protein
MQLPKEFEFVCVWGQNETLYQESLSRKGKVVFVTLDSPLQMEPMARKIGWEAVFKKLDFIHAAPGGEEFKREVERSQLAADFGVKVYRNAKQNRGFKRGMALQGAFPNVPAIIVGAGPSLKEKGQLLKQFKNRALIFATGSSLNQIEVEPDFAVSLDPEAIIQHRFRHVPICCQARVNPDHLAQMEGEKLLFPDSFWEGLNWIFGEDRFDGGWTAGNFGAAIARLWGCNPIYFVGMDFCSPEPKENSIPWQGAWTQKDWMMAAEWMETFGGSRELPRELPQKFDLKIPHLPPVTNRWEEWEKSLQRCRQTGSEEEIVYQKLLEPLWAIWKPLFPPEDDLNLHKQLFFQQILAEHA